MASENGWNEWSKHVLAELERLNDGYEEINKNVNKIRVEIAMLQVKSGIWGVIGGCIPLMVAFMFWLLKSK